MTLKFNQSFPLKLSQSKLNAMGQFVISAILAFEPFYREGFPGKHASFKVKHEGCARQSIFSLPCIAGFAPLTGVHW
jgi:hypothetical protein